MKTPTTHEQIGDPTRFYWDLLRDYITGKLDGQKFLYRAEVLEIDHVGGQLSESPPNPKNSIKARIVTDGVDLYKSDDDLVTFWPLFPYDVMPLKESEHVYVIFEDPETREHGLWITRIPENNTTHSLNITPGVKKFQDFKPQNKNLGTTEKGEHATSRDSASKKEKQAKVSKEFSREETPEHKARVGDRVIKGSNNTVISLGRDRKDKTDSGEEKESGTIDLVAGKDGEEVSFKNDKSRVYVTAKSDVDGNFDIKTGDSSGPSAGIVLKSDEIRIVARKGMKIVVEGGEARIAADNITVESKDVTVESGKVTVDSGNIALGKNPTDRLILGEKYKLAKDVFLNELVGALSPFLVAVAAELPIYLPPAANSAATAGSAVQLLSAAVVKFLAADETYLSNITKTKKQ